MRPWADWFWVYAGHRPPTAAWVSRVEHWGSCPGTAALHPSYVSRWSCAVLRFVANHTYRVFAWYRIVFVAVVAAWIFTR